MELNDLCKYTCIILEEITFFKLIVDSSAQNFILPSHVNVWVNVTSDPKNQRI